jgi:hypothetical protein
MGLGPDLRSKTIMHLQAWGSVFVTQKARIMKEKIHSLDLMKMEAFGT